MKTSRVENLLLMVAAGCAAAAGWMWWADRPTLRYSDRLDLVGLVVKEPREIAVELANDGDQPRKVIGARAY